jgi:cytochrome c oxidase subunit 2
MIVNNRLIAHKHITHGTTLECVWTLIPALILVTIAIPSFQLLYLIDEIIDPSVTVRAIGLQWY